MRVFLSLFLVLVVSTGCKISMETVEKWKKSGDTARLKKCLADNKQSDKVRSAAGLALFDLGRYYGVEVKLGEVKQRSKEEAVRIATLMSAALFPELKGTDNDAVRAKDGLFSLWEFVSKEDKKKLEQKIAKWLMDNWVSVSHSGEHSARKIFEKWGERGGRALSEEITLAHADLYDLSVIIYETASAEDREKLAKRFALELDKNPVLLSRGDRLHAIGKLCSKTSLSFLQRTAMEGFNLSIRRNAIIGLRLCPHPSSIAAALATLKELQEKALKNERVELPQFKDKMPGLIHQVFELLDAINDPERSIPGMKKILTLTSSVPLKEENRERALLIRTLTGQYLVFIGKIDGLKILLENIPDDEYPGGYILALGDAVRREFAKNGRDEALEVLRSALKSADWVGRIIALETLALMGDKEKDAKLLDSLRSDRTSLKGWGQEGVTMGERATIALKRLEK